MEKIQKFSDIRNKEVVNVLDGSKLGYIDDLDIDTADGKIKNIIIYIKNKTFGLFESTVEELIIDWNEIKMIGNETILVDIKEYKYTQE